MGKLIYIALEDLEQRYTIMMNRAVEKHCDVYVYPEDYQESGKIETGEFLDINKTCIFKALQLRDIALMFYQGKVQDGDAFFVADIFFPGIEMIRYMSELQGIKVYIYGINYAGRSDPNDFVQNLNGWSDVSEKGYHLVCDRVFVGSIYHYHNIIAHFGRIFANRVFVTGLIWDIEYVESVHSRNGNKKEDYIIFPHRICKEKGIDEFWQYAENTDKKIIITSSGNKQELERELPKNVEYRYNLSKKEYYEIMSRARWYISTAYQETFGYTLQEAIFYGCEVLVPDRACYPEMVPVRNLYKEVEEIDIKFAEGSKIVDFRRTQKWHDNARVMVDFIRRNSCREKNVGMEER